MILLLVVILGLAGAVKHNSDICSLSLAMSLGLVVLSMWGSIKTGYFKDARDNILRSVCLCLGISILKPSSDIILMSNDICFLMILFGIFLFVVWLAQYRD